MVENPMILQQQFLRDLDLIGPLSCCPADHVQPAETATHLASRRLNRLRRRPPQQRAELKVMVRVRFEKTGPENFTNARAEIM